MTVRPIPGCFILAILVLTSLRAQPVYSAEPGQNAGQIPAVIRVGVIPLDPFVITTGGKPRGISVELWEEIARSHGWKYEYTFLPATGYPDFVPELEGNKFDVVIGPVIVTYQRLSDLSFSIPYYISTSNVIAKNEPSTFLFLFVHLIENTFKRPLIILLLIIFLCSFLIWHKEKRNFPDVFPQTFHKGIRYSIWYGFHTLFSNDIFFEIKDTYARVLAIVMLVCSLATGSILAATLTSALTLSHTGRKTDIDELEDLKGQTVAVIGGTDIDDYLQNLDFSVVEKKSLGEALLALDNEEVVAVIADRLTVKSYLRDKNMSDIRVSDMVIRSNILSFALRKSSPLREPINKSIVNLENSNWIYRMCLHYLDRRDAAFCTL